MTKEELPISAFSQYLFWDVRNEDIDLDEHARYVVNRVLECGMLEDWHLILGYYGLPKIVELAKGMRDLEPRALAFISAISNTSIEEFRCYTYQQSIPRHWNF
jgi:hypothetical protein